MAIIISIGVPVSEFTAHYNHCAIILFLHNYLNPILLYLASHKYRTVICRRYYHFRSPRIWVLPPVTFWRQWLCQEDKNNIRRKNYKYWILFSLRDKTEFVSATQIPWKQGANNSKVRASLQFVENVDSWKRSNCYLFQVIEWLIKLTQVKKPKYKNELWNHEAWKSWNHEAWRSWNHEAWKSSLLQNVSHGK